MGFDGKRNRAKTPRLTPEEKRERDARATHWMNQRKIERIAEGAWRHGWHTVSPELVEQCIKGEATELDEAGELVLVIADSGRYRVYRYDEEQDMFIVRKIEDFAEVT